jgi:cytochrome P450
MGFGSIPKGTAVLVDGWALHHEKACFKNLESFDPNHYKGQTALASQCI